MTTCCSKPPQPYNYFISVTYNHIRASVHMSKFCHGDTWWEGGSGHGNGGGAPPTCHLISNAVAALYTSHALRPVRLNKHTVGIKHYLSCTCVRPYTQECKCGIMRYPVSSLHVGGCSGRLRSHVIGYCWQSRGFHCNRFLPDGQTRA